MNGTEAAFCFNLFCRQLSESYVSWPATLFGWMGKLLVKASVKGMEKAVVAVTTVAVCFSNVNNKVVRLLC